MRRENFDGNSAIKPSVASTIDLTSATRPKRCNDFVRPEFGASREDHRCAIIGSLDPSLPVIRRNQACYIALAQTCLLPQKSCYLLVRFLRHGPSMSEYPN